MTAPLHHISISRVPDTDTVAATLTRGDDDPVVLTGTSTKGADIMLDKGHKFVRGWVSADRRSWRITCLASDVRISGSCESRGGVLSGWETGYDPGRFALLGETKSERNVT
jgi:hypothetical protein